MLALSGQRTGLLTLRQVDRLLPGADDAGGLGARWPAAVDGLPSVSFTITANHRLLNSRPRTVRCVAPIQITVPYTER